MSFGQKCGRRFMLICESNRNLGYFTYIALGCSLWIGGGFCSIAYAADPAPALAEEVSEVKPVTPLTAMHANWVFSGTVANENGDRYEYFFQAKRKKNMVHATISLVDAQSKAVIFMETAEAQLADPHTDDWMIGDIFLRYNTINRSWIFGLKKPNQIGFNFKVDTMNQPEHTPKIQKVRRGVMMSVVQTGEVNGHIQFEENAAAQFVSGKNAWFRQLVMNDKSSKKLPALQGLLCRFNDGSGLYSMQMGTGLLKHNRYVGSYDAEGIAAAISKSIQVDHLASGQWRVKVPYPKLQFDLSDVLQNQGVVLGFVDHKQKSGFCVISKEEDLA